MSIPADATVLLSINRFERKKNIGLAVRALQYLEDHSDDGLEAIADGRAFLGSKQDAILGASTTRGTVGTRGDGKKRGRSPARKGSRKALKEGRGVDKRALHLVLAGGYDVRVPENVEHMEELKDLAQTLGVSSKVTFVPSFSDEEREVLFDRCSAVLYTPDREHFGIVPLEAMLARCPVIAVASGGPLETVKSGFTGYLCDDTPEMFGRAIAAVLPRSAEMGDAGRQHVIDHFTMKAFGQRLDEVATALVAERNA